MKASAAVHSGLVEACNVPPNSLFQLIPLFDSDEIILAPFFSGVNRSKDVFVIEVVILLRRTEDQKLALFRQNAQHTIQAGFRADGVMIALV
ncbi:tautomerase family protein [Rhodoferax mekongensis]|uniref:Tautomerase family protein n=1 Tax=Rhodoferax mekongensis TaxID=3068341 RepID=A0ABZ0AZ25_9BURK|nr:tautomerase family protein [Rhodoferax sp. TBRC 17307]WNO03962.1 tautomerase family protein [Rhodoferax sp. TBRC 17307]